MKDCERIAMTKSEYEKERRAFWDACFKTCVGLKVAEALTLQEMTSAVARVCDSALAERDKRFPAPESETK